MKEIIKNPNGIKAGHVSVLPDKDEPDSYNIILIFKEDEKAKSVRSTTEMINKMKEKGISHNKIVKTVEKVSNFLEEKRKE